ncbi:MAG: hypothetical protein OXI22_03265 [Defluviicoccus sp.]|nr:hypothetical protein [Defluviicoccus sp.]MDE0382879.1 hypothetical protein [Defluviicoccus sp.]
MIDRRPPLAAAALVLPLAAAPANAHMSPECSAAITSYASSVAYEAAAWAMGLTESEAAVFRKATRSNAEFLNRECLDDRYAGLQATMVRAIDGGTIEVDARLGHGQTMRVAVRLAGYDAPQPGGGCAAEREAAAAAKAALERLLPVGAVVRLADLRDDNRAGRVVARVAITEGGFAAESLLAQGHGRADDGGRGSWCP